jgi:catechol 2,3-dioxygenase-like lactoylglutathione lyase family enzyme
MVSMFVNIDVPDLSTAIEFYCEALGLRLARKLFEGTVAELLGGSSPIYLLAKALEAPQARASPCLATIDAIGPRCI